MKIRFAISLVAILANLAISSETVEAAESKMVGNIIIVHGAFADGSGWRKVSDILTKRGLNVMIVQEPLTSFREDVEATNRILDLQDGPTILVGHSYGGMVISESGNHPNVAGLVYVAAFQPDRGDSLFALASSKPAEAKGIKETKDGKYLYLDPSAFASDFASDLPKSDADFLARSQVLASKEAASASISNPAWRSKKSWAIVATQDRAINPDLERDMAKRAGSTTIEIKSSHAVFASHSRDVADLISKAAKEAGNATK